MGSYEKGINYKRRMKNRYRAIFRSEGDETFRLDTRVYLKEINEPQDSDICVGAVVGKNPGSAKPVTH